MTIISSVCDANRQFLCEIQKVAELITSLAVVGCCHFSYKYYKLSWFVYHINFRSDSASAKSKQYITYNPIISNEFVNRPTHFSIDVTGKGENFIGTSAKIVG